MLLVAVSGGIDSMCLADKVRLSGEPFAIAHCNFCLRGDESDGDEALVRRWAASNSIVCHVRSFDTRSYSAQKGISIEMAARELRYKWFGSLCREYGYEAVAVAHNAQDNAETLILNLLRGTGLRGILGMKPSGFIPVAEYSDIPLLRPLLGMTREEIEEYASAAGLPFRDDSTNFENDYKRNKLRNLVFPVFREINPSFVRTLNRDMERFGEEIPPLAAPVRDDGESAVLEISPLEFTMGEENWNGGSALTPPGELILDAEKVRGELHSRPWKDGDRFRPLGLNGSKKLQDWFTDRHFPLEEKRRALVFVGDGDTPLAILSPVSSAIDHRVRITSSTRKILRIKLNSI